MGSKILLLEDDVTLNETVAEYLEDNGYDVKAVYDGEEALNLMYEKTFDLFILDVNVPFVDGFTLLKERRGSQRQDPCHIYHLIELHGVFGAGLPKRGR